MHRRLHDPLARNFAEIGPDLAGVQSSDRQGSRPISGMSCASAD